MPSFSSESPFSTPKTQKPQQTQQSVQQPQEQTFEPQWDEQTTRHYAGTYRNNPAGYSEEQLNSIRQHASYYNVPFYEGEFSVLEALKQAAGGVIEGFTTFNWVDPPDNEYEAVARNLGHLVGFVPGILSKPLKMINAKNTARRLSALTSAPMFGATLIQDQARKIISPTLKAARKSRYGAMKSATDFLLGNKAKHIFEGAFHLGLASGISSWQHGVDEMIHSAKGGFLAGGIFRSIGNFINVGNPTGNKLLRGMTGSLFMGLPSTLQGQTTPEQVYEYVMGAYFGGMEGPWTRKYATDYLKKMEKHARKHKSFRKSMDPEEMPGWKKVPEEVKPIIKEYAKEGIPGTDFKGYGDPEMNRAINWFAAQQSGALKGFTDKGEAIIRRAGFEVTPEIRDGERIYKLSKEVYEKWEKYGVSTMTPGASMIWDAVLNKYGMPLIHHTWPEHRKAQRKAGIKPKGFEYQLSRQELAEADIKVAEANVSLGVPKLEKLNEYQKNLIRKNWFTVKHADAIFSVDKMTPNKKGLEGISRWAAQMGIDKGIDVWNLNPANNKWYKYRTGPRKFVEVKAPKELPTRSAFIGGQKIGQGKNAQALRKSMESLISENFKPIKGKIPPLKGDTPENIKALKNAKNELENENKDLVKEYSKNIEKIDKENDLDMLDALKIRQEEIREILKENKKELTKLDKSIELERYDKEGELKESPEAQVDDLEVDNNQRPGMVGLGAKAIRFVNTHLKDVWNPLENADLQLIEQARLADVLTSTLNSHRDRVTKVNNSEKWAAEAANKIQKGFSFKPEAKRALRQWMSRENNDEYVQMYGWNGKKLAKLRLETPLSGSGNRMQQKHPLLRIDKVWQSYGKEGRAFGILDRITVYNDRGRKVDLNLTSYRNNFLLKKNKWDLKLAQIEWDAKVSDIMKKLAKDNKYIWGGKGDADRLTFVKYHPLSGNKEAIKQFDKIFSKNNSFKLSENTAKSKYKMDAKTHKKQYISNLLYNYEMNGFKLSGKGSKTLQEIHSLMNEKKKDGTFKHGFIRDSKAFNKRSQIWGDIGYSADVGFIKTKIKDLSKDNYKFIIARDLPKNIKKELFKYINTKNIALPESVDGAIITRRDVLEANIADAGLPSEGGNSKSVIVSPHAEKGALLGKYMMHDAGKTASAAMKKAGIHYIMMDSAVKQRGTRSLGDYEVSKTGRLKIEGEIHELPVRDIQYSYSVFSDKHLAKWQRLPKQVMTNLLTTNWKPTDKAVIKDMLTELVGKRFRGEAEWNTKMEDLLSMSEGSEKNSLMREVVDNLDKVGIVELIGSAKVNGNESLSNAIYGKLMKQTKGFLDMQVQEGEITKEQKTDMVRELNDSKSVAETVMKVSPGIHTTLHKFANKYRFAVVQNFIMDALTKPKINNSLAARMRPYDKWLRNKIDMKGTDDTIFYLDDGYRETRVEHNIKGAERIKTLGELWDNRKKFENSKNDPEESANIDKVLNALVVRVPMDSMSGAHKLKFNGFTGRKGQGVLLHSRTMRALGGADLDADEAFVFFGGKGGFKESWKDAYNANKKEYYKAEHKRTGKEISFSEYEKLTETNKKNYKLLVGDNKADSISDKVAKLLNANRGDTKTYGIAGQDQKIESNLRDLLTIKKLGLDYGLKDIQSQTNDMMYSPVERIRISTAAVDGRAMLGSSAIVPKQIMQAAYSTILAGEGKDSWTTYHKKGEWRIHIKPRTEDFMQDYQRQLTRAMVGFTSDPLDEAGLKTPEAWFRYLFDAHFKVTKIEPVNEIAKKINGKDGPPQVGELTVGGLKGIYGSEKSIYGKLYGMNSAMYGRNYQMNRKYNISEIKRRLNEVNEFTLEQKNTSLANLADILEPVDWSDNISTRVDRIKLKNLYKAYKENVKQFNFLKTLMGRSTFAVPESKTVYNALKYKLFDTKQINRYGQNLLLFRKAIKGTDLEVYIDKKYGKKAPPEDVRIHLLESIKERADDFLINDISDINSLMKISEYAKKLNAKELAKIPSMHKFAEHLKLNSYLMNKERKFLSMEQLSEAVESKNVKTEVEKLWERYLKEIVEEGALGEAEALKLKMRTSESASMDQFQVDNRIRKYKEKLNPKEQKMFDLLMLGTFRRGDIAKIDQAVKKFGHKWDAQTVELVKRLKSEAAKTSLSQLGFASQAIPNSSKKEILDGYGKILKDVEMVSNKEIDKHIKVIEDLEMPSVEKELPEFVSDKIVETGVEGLKEGKLNKETQSIITSLVDNLKSYNNKISQNLPFLTRSIIQKNLNAMNKQDWVVMDNYFKELKKGTIFQAFSKNELQKLSRRHYWLFPKTINRELMKYDIQLMRGNGMFLDRFGELHTGLIKSPTHYQDMLQTWIGRMNDQATKKTDEWTKILQESLMFVNSIPEGEVLRRGAVHRRQLGYAELIQKDKRKNQSERSAITEKYFKRWQKWEKKHNDLLDKKYVITHKGERKTKTGRQIMRMVNNEYTKVFEEMHKLITGQPDMLAKFSTTKLGDKNPSFNVPKFIDYLKEAWGKGKDVSTEFGIDGLRFIARSMMQNHANRTGSKEFKKYLRSNKLQKTGKIPFEYYWPHMMFDKKDADKALKGAYKKILNDPKMSKQNKTKELKNIILKHKKLTGDWNFRDIEEWDIYDQALQELAKGKKMSKDTIKWFSENQRSGSMYKRDNHIEGWSVDSNVPETYIRSLSNTYHRQLSNIFSREIIHKMQNPTNSFYKKYGKDQAHAWANFMKLYVQDALGNATVIPDYMYNMDIMKLKGTPYAAWADNRVRNRINSIMAKLGIGDKQVDEVMRGISLQQLRNWSNLEAQYEMASLLAHPKSMVNNIFGGTMHTVQSAGISNFVKARSIKWLKQNISDKFNSMTDVDRFVTKHGVLPEYMLEEFGMQKALQQQRNIDFIKEVAGKITRDPEMSETTLRSIQKKYGAYDTVVRWASNFMSVPERAIRRDAFMAHYINAWQKFGGAVENPDHPMLIELAKKGVRATQFLYSAPYRPAFARTALGKVMTRFQLWSWNAVRFRNDVSRQARIYGLRPGTESYDKYKRTRQIDLFVFALANMFPYSLFELSLPAPWNWLQDTSDWVFGDEKERNRAFFGQWPTQVAPLQMITPPILRMLPATARAILDDDWSKMAQYHIYAMFPFGRIIKDLAPWHERSLVNNPIRIMEKTTGLPIMQLQRFMQEEKDEETRPPSPGEFF